MKEPTGVPEPLPRDQPGQRPAQEFESRRVHQITGTFVLMVVLVLIAAIVWTGSSQRLFKSNITLRIKLPEAGAAGIRQGSEVYFLGTLVGSVHNVLVDTNGRMEARTFIRHDFFRFVRADSSAVVKRKFSLAGDSFFEISRGEGAPLPEENASILCKEQLQSALEAAVEEIRGETLLALKKMTAGLDVWAALGTNLIESGERVDQLIARADNIAMNLQQGKGTAGKLLNDPSTADELETLLLNANHSLDGLQITLKNLESASGNLQQASTNLPSLGAALDRDAKEMPALILQTRTSMVELERVIEAVQRHWMLRKYVNKTNPAPRQPLAAGDEPENKPVKALPSPKSSGK
jgi:phospholipid/cholesterol/gamma-HCH transport system substrate-binding protein